MIILLCLLALNMDGTVLMYISKCIKGVLQRFYLKSKIIVTINYPYILCRFSDNKQGIRFTPGPGLDAHDALPVRTVNGHSYG